MKKSAYKNIITIDGPAGSGKSTIAKILARDLGMKYIDTGAMYRAITLIALENNIGLKDEKSILEIASGVKLEIDLIASDENSYTKLFLDGRDVTESIRSPEVGSAVSIVSKLPGIRRYLVSIQRKIASEGNTILEGRDTGSVVCPDAVLKIFLTASISERVKRRKLQMEAKNQEFTLNLINEEIKKRDFIDSNRKDSPLVIPGDGIKLDTSDMSIPDVVNKIKELYYDCTKTKI
jgi:cytidylate kinase